MVSIVIGRRAAAGTSLASAVLGIAVLAPRTGRIAMITVIRSAVSAGAAGCRSAMLTGRRIAPRAAAHAMTGVFIIRIAAVAAIGFAPVLTGRILLPASITVTMAAGIDRLTLGLPASTAIITVSVAGASSRLLALKHPCMAAAVRAGTGTVTTSAVTLIGVSAKVLDVVAEITLIIVCMTTRRMCDFNVCALERILSA